MSHPLGMILGCVPQSHRVPCGTESQSPTALTHSLMHPALPCSLPTLFVHFLMWASWEQGQINDLVPTYFPLVPVSGPALGGTQTGKLAIKHYYYYWVPITIPLNRWQNWGSERWEVAHGYTAHGSNNPYLSGLLWGSNESTLKYKWAS